MSLDMSGWLCDTPGGTTAAVSNAAASVPAGQCRNRTPAFITGVVDKRHFLASLRSRWPKCLTAQMKGKTLMVVSETGHRQRSEVARCEQGSEFSHPLAPWGPLRRLLVKNLGRHMLEGIGPTRAGIPWHLCPRGHAAKLGAPRPEPWGGPPRGVLVRIVSYKGKHCIFVSCLSCSPLMTKDLQTSMPIFSRSLPNYLREHITGHTEHAWLVENVLHNEHEGQKWNASARMSRATIPRYYRRIPDFKKLPNTTGKMIHQQTTDRSGTGDLELVHP